MSAKCKPNECFINLKTTKRLRKLLKDEAKKMRLDDGQYYSVNSLIVRAIRQCYVLEAQKPSGPETAT